VSLPKVSVEATAYYLTDPESGNSTVQFEGSWKIEPQGLHEMIRPAIAAISRDFYQRLAILAEIALEAQKQDQDPDLN
jgi:hypothetical protein